MQRTKEWWGTQHIHAFLVKQRLISKHTNEAETARLKLWFSWVCIFHLRPILVSWNSSRNCGRDKSRNRPSHKSKALNLRLNRRSMILACYVCTVKIREVRVTFIYCKIIYVYANIHFQIGCLMLHFFKHVILWFKLSWNCLSSIGAFKRNTREESTVNQINTLISSLVFGSFASAREY